MVGHVLDNGVWVPWMEKVESFGERPAQYEGNGATDPFHDEEPIECGSVDLSTPEVCDSCQ